MSYQVIVVGGGTAGLAAALTLGRAMIRTLVIDGGSPCNRFADHSFNFLTHDGDKPRDILAAARSDISKYKTVEIVSDKVLDVAKDANFVVNTPNHQYTAKRLIIASGIIDDLSESGIKSLEKFWGKSIIHCPYCHGYEHVNKRTGLIVTESIKNHLADFVPMIYNWSQNLHLFTNGVEVPEIANVTTISGKVVEAEGSDGNVSALVLEDGSRYPVDAAYMHPSSQLPLGDIWAKLGVTTQNGLITVNPMQGTTADGVYAAGDCTTPMRSLATANYQGQMAGAMASRSLFAEAWPKI